MNRYEWQDRLVDAQVAGQISNGALLVCSKLARAINWSPKNGRPSGLYWKNDDAFKAVGIGRGTYYNHKDELFEAGFLTMEGGNLLPSLPPESTGCTEDKEKKVQTMDSKVQTMDYESPQVGLEKSIGCNPFSEDTFSEDVLSEDTFTVDSTSVADAPDVPTIPNSVVRERVVEEITSPPNLEEAESALTYEVDKPTVQPMDYDPTETFNTRSKELQRQKELAASIPEEW